jgi:PA14 domain
LLAVTLLIVRVPCIAQQPQEQDPVYVFGTTVVIPSGLQGTIYYISHSAKSLTELKKFKPRGTIYTSSLNVPTQDYMLGFPGISKRLEWFAIDYSGKFWIGTPGEYRWELTSDDGSMLYIDDKLLIDNGGMHAAIALSGTTQLSGGIHTIRVPYFQGIKYRVALILKIAGPGQDLRVFSTEEFKPPADPETWAFPATPAKK